MIIAPAQRNGAEAPSDLPAIQISWDGKTQTVGLSFDPKEFKTWDFLIAVIQMAQDKAETYRRMATMQGIAQQQQDAAMAEAIKGQLMARQ